MNEWIPSFPRQSCPSGSCRWINSPPAPHLSQNEKLGGPVVSQGCTKLCAPRIDFEHQIKGELDHVHHLSVWPSFLLLASQKRNIFNEVKSGQSCRTVWTFDLRICPHLNCDCPHECRKCSHSAVKLIKMTIEVTFEHLQGPHLSLEIISSSCSAADDDYDRKTQCYIIFCK